MPRCSVTATDNFAPTNPPNRNSPAESRPETERAVPMSAMAAVSENSNVLSTRETAAPPLRENDRRFDKGTSMYGPSRSSYNTASSGLWPVIMAPPGIEALVRVGLSPINDPGPLYRPESGGTGGAMPLRAKE